MAGIIGTASGITGNSAAYGVGTGPSSTDATFNPYTANWTGASGPADAATIQNTQNSLNTLGLTAGSGGIVSSAATPSATPAPTAAPTSTTNGAVQLGSPTQWNITPDQTVQGRIASIVGNPNDPLQVQARNQVNEAANQKGLLNSGMAAEAGQEAAYSAALPIATADAATAAKAAGYNADQSNQFQVTNANAANTFGLANINNAAQYAQTQLQSDTSQKVATMNAASTQAIATMNADSQQRIATLDAANKLQAQQLSNENNTLLQTNQQAAQAFNTAMSAINNIQNNNQMDATAKTQAVAAVWSGVQTQLKVLGSVSGLDLTGSLNFSNYPGFDASGNWVGFGAGTTTTTAPQNNGAAGQ